MSDRHSVVSPSPELSENVTEPTDFPVEKVKRSRWLFFCAAYGFFGLAVGMDSTYDLRNYHFFDPFWVFVDGMRGVAPGGAQSFLNPLLSAPFYFGPRYLPPILFQILIGAVQGLSGPLLYLIARELKLTKPQAFFTALLGMYASTALSEVGNAQGDTLVAPLLLGAVLFLLRTANYPSLSPKVQVRYYLIAGLLAGAAVGLKETVVCLGFGIGVLTLETRRVRRTS